MGKTIRYNVELASKALPVSLCLSACAAVEVWDFMSGG